MTANPRVAFYAPMKSPTHERPSGDREIARRFVHALEQSGASVEIASELRARDGTGSADTQSRIEQQAQHEAQMLIERYRKEQPPTHWFTYHLFHKAPDWIGPRVAEALGIPYIVAEASFAPKQAGGRWDKGHRQVERALRHASAVVVLNPVDLECVAPLLDSRCVVLNLPVWIDIEPPQSSKDQLRRQFASTSGITDDTPWLVTVAMMRDGDKTRSYELLADALTQITGESWRLLIAGDGESSARVKAQFAELADRVVFLGALEKTDISNLLGAGDIMVWPAVNEAIGMSLLEAQAHGLPVVAGDSGGVHTVVEAGKTGLLTPVGVADKFADAISQLLNDDQLRQRFSSAAIAHVATNHSTRGAAARLQTLLKDTAR